ncbi:MAG: PDZ domain-containing protein [Thermoplasmata archaeon]|nr:PDZ domain-containing protein [Thermoplasmata archaeon]
MTIHYLVSAEDAAGHRALVRLRFDPLGAGSVDLVLPSWTPGSYRIDPYARNVQWLRAFAGSAGKELVVERTGSGRWRLSTTGAREVEVRYSVFGHGLVTEGLDVTPEHLFLNAAIALLFVEGRDGEAIELSLELPDGWKIVTELKEKPGSPRSYLARDYAELVDSPVDAGTPTVLMTTTSGAPLRIALCGTGGNYNPERLENDFSKLAEAADRLFGVTAVEPYTFFLHLGEVPDGGLEHASSSSCVFARGAFRPEKEYRRVLAVASHEYIHRYNGKRIRPERLARPDLTREVHTRLLWLVEGTTDYYAYVLLTRAGLLPPPKLFEHYGGLIARLLDTPGRSATSLEEGSFLSWVGEYRPYEQSANQFVSYYLKGHLASLGLDLEIRHRSSNERSLDDVMRTLQREYGATGRGVGESEFPEIAARATGLDLAPFIGKLVRGTEELDLASALRHAGLLLGAPKKDSDPDPSPETAYLGARTENASGLVRLSSVLDGGPAQKAGLSAGDELVAIAGAKVTSEHLSAVLARFVPGTEVTVTVFRRGLLVQLPITLGKAPPEKLELLPAESTTELERSIFERWLESKWAPPTASKNPSLP